MSPEGMMIADIYRELADEVQAMADDGDFPSIDEPEEAPPLRVLPGGVTSTATPASGLPRVQRVAAGGGR